MANVTVVMTAEEAGLWRAQQRLIDQQRKMEEGYRKTGEAGGRAGDKVRGAGKEHDKAFGARAIGQLKNYVLGLVGVQAGVSAVTGALTAMIKELDTAREKAAGRIPSARMGFGLLATLATSTQEMQALTGRARAFFRAGGAEGDVGAAANEIFKLVSAGVDQSMDKTFADLRAWGVVQQPGLMAKAAGTLMASMGKAETGTFRDIISKSFPAAAVSPETAEALLIGAAQAGKAAATVGLSDEEVLAAMGVMARTRGSAEMAGTQLQRFLLTVAQKDEFGGMNLGQIVQNIEARGMRPAEMQKWFGRVEGMLGFQNLRDQMELYQQTLVGVEKAQAEDVVGQKLRFAQMNLGARTDYRRLIQENREILAEEDMGVRRTMSNALIRSARADILEGKRELGFPLNLLSTEAQATVLNRYARMARPFVGEFGPQDVFAPPGFGRSVPGKGPFRRMEMTDDMRAIIHREAPAAEGSALIPTYLPTGEQIGQAAGRMIAMAMAPGIPMPMTQVNETVVSAISSAPRPLSPGLAIDR